MADAAGEKEFMDFQSLILAGFYGARADVKELKKMLAKPRENKKVSHEEFIRMNPDKFRKK